MSDSMHSRGESKPKSATKKLKIITTERANSQKLIEFLCYMNKFYIDHYQSIMSLLLVTEMQS